MRNRNFDYYNYDIRKWKEIIVTLVIVALNLIAGVYGLIDKSAPIKFAMNVYEVEQGNEYYRFFSYMFFHFGLEHLLMNMVALFGLGRLLERYVGHVKLAIIYVLSGLCGSAMIMYIGNEYTITVGASGAIYGLMGALLVYMILNRDYSMLNQMILLLMINLISTLTDERISMGAHLGGLVGGLALGIILVRREYD